MVPNVKSNPAKLYTEASADAIAVAGKVPTQLFIGGERLKAKDARAFDVVDPSTATVIAKVADGDVADALAAVDAAAAAADAWKAASPRRRSDILMKCFHLMLERSDWLARLISAENGKALPDARSEVTIAALVEDAISKGARVVTGGSRPSGEGFYYPPTVLADVPNNAALLSEEIFGPVAPIVAFDTEDEVVRMANDTEYGLVAYVFSRDLKRALAVAGRIESGMVGINRGVVSDAAAPFGGMKQSGLGREGSHHGMLEYLETKYIAATW